MKQEIQQVENSYEYGVYIYIYIYISTTIALRTKSIKSID